MSSIAEWQQVQEIAARVERLSVAMGQTAEMLKAWETRLTEMDVRLDDMRAAVDGLKAALLAKTDSQAQRQAQLHALTKR